MNDKVLNIVSSQEIRFKVKKLLTGKAVWVSPEMPGDHFFDRFGYIIGDQSTLEELSIDHADEKSYGAERYGGAGIGDNGGGVRVISLP